MQYKEFEINIESFAKILDLLNVMKRVYKYESISISEKFIEKKRKDEMLEIISNIGLKYEKSISKIVNLWRKEHGNS